MNTVATEPTTGRPARPSLLHEPTGLEWNPNAEQAVLGGILVVPEVAEAVADILEPADFFLPSNRKIYSAILTLRSQGTPVDQITVADEVSGDADVETQGGRSYIWSLPGTAVPAVNAPHHARIVKDLAVRRRAKDIGWALVEGRLSAAEAQADLEELCATQGTEGLPTIVAIDFCREVPEEPNWILPGYLARGTITELDAKIKTGKTHLAVDLVRAILAGEEFIGRQTVPTPVLYLSEERQTTFRAALKRVGLENAAGLHLAFRQDTRASWPEIGRAVIARAKVLGVGLIVCDTLSDWSGLEADKENDAGAALAAMRPLQAMAAAGLAVLGLRHERKSGGEVGESARGSSAFGGAADILLSLKKDPTVGHENRRVLEAVGRLDGLPPRLVLEMTDGHYRSLGTSAQVEADKARELVVQILPDNQDEALTEKDILDQAKEQADDKITRSTLKRVLDDLLTEGVVAKAKSAGAASSRAYGFWMNEEGRL